MVGVALERGRFAIAFMSLAVPGAISSCTGQTVTPQAQIGNVNGLGGAGSGGTSPVGTSTLASASTACPGGMLGIGAGDFLMGSDPSEPVARADELPRHRVTLRSYCLDVYEATNAQYKACVDAGRCTMPRSVEPPSGIADAARAKRPVVGLSWEQASAYCGWSNKRLPTEAEWEKAARGAAPDTRLYPWGDITSPNPTTIYFCPQEADVDSPTFDVSPYGLKNMVSGAPEWVADWYDAGYYAVSPIENPSGPESGTQHVVRSSLCAACAETLPPRRVAYRQTCGERSIEAVGVRCASDPTE